MLEDFLANNQCKSLWRFHKTAAQLVGEPAPAAAPLPTIVSSRRFLLYLRRPSVCLVRLQRLRRGRLHPPVHRLIRDPSPGQHLHDRLPGVLIPSAHQLLLLLLHTLLCPNSRCGVRKLEPDAAFKCRSLPSATHGCKRLLGFRAQTDS